MQASLLRTSSLRTSWKTSRSGPTSAATSAGSTPSSRRSPGASAKGPIRCRPSGTSGQIFRRPCSASPWLDGAAPTRSNTDFVRLSQNHKRRKSRSFASRPICNLRQARRFAVPCFSNNHSPAPLSVRVPLREARDERGPKARRNSRIRRRRLQPARGRRRGSDPCALASAAPRPHRRSSDRKFASAVTGRFDIIVDIVVAGDVADLYHVELIPGVGEPGEIVRSETFVVMTSCNKWVSLPKGCWSDDTEAVAPRRKELP